MICFEPREELQNFFGLLGVVPLVGLGDDPAVGGDQDVLAGGAAHVDAANLAGVRGKISRRAQLRRYG